MGRLRISGHSDDGKLTLTNKGSTINGGVSAGDRSTITNTGAGT